MHWGFRTLACAVPWRVEIR